MRNSTSALQVDKASEKRPLPLYFSVRLSPHTHSCHCYRSRDTLSPTSSSSSLCSAFRPRPLDTTKPIHIGPDKSTDQPTLDLRLSETRACICSRIKRERQTYGARAGARQARKVGQANGIGIIHNWPWPVWGKYICSFAFSSPTFVTCKLFSPSSSPGLGLGLVH